MKLVKKQISNNSNAKLGVRMKAKPKKLTASNLAKISKAGKLLKASRGIKRDGAQKYKGKTLPVELPLGVPTTTIDQAVSIILKLHNDRKDKSKMLLLKDDSSVFLQINLLKIPEIEQPRRKYLKLHHSLWGDDAEVCLFVENKRNRDKAVLTPDERIEMSIEYYEDILKQQGVEGITAIMPAFQVSTEYDSYELKRKLIDRFDVFLAQSTLLEDSKFMKHVGVAFNRKNKMPIVVKFPKDYKKPDPAFKQRISDALRTTWFHLRPHANSYSVKIGNLSQTAEELHENITRVLGQLPDEEVIPGGSANIKSLMLKTTRSPAVPLYMSLASRDSVPSPKVRSYLPKERSATDELSTLPGKKVTVLPSGEVFVTADENFKPPPNWSDDEEDSSLDEEDEPQQDSLDKQKRHQKMKHSGEESDDDVTKDDNHSSSSEDEMEVVAVEDEYINRWGNEGNEEEDEDAPPIKERKKDKKKAQRLQKNAATTIPAKDKKKKPKGKQVEKNSDAGNSGPASRTQRKQFLQKEVPATAKATRDNKSKVLKISSLSPSEAKKPIQQKVRQKKNKKQNKA